MKKLLLFSLALVLLAGCEKMHIQKMCEQEAREYLLGMFSPDVTISNIKFYDLYEADLPKDSMPAYKSLYAIQNLLNRYVELYGEDTTQTIFDTQFRICDYEKIIFLLENSQKYAAELDKVYTSKNYIMQCDFTYDVKIELTVLFIFNKDYKHIDREIIN